MIVVVQFLALFTTIMFLLWASMEGALHRQMTMEHSRKYSRGRLRDFWREFRSRRWRRMKHFNGLEPANGDDLNGSNQIHASLLRFDNVQMLLPVWSYWIAAIEIRWTLRQLSSSQEIPGHFSKSKRSPLHAVRGDE